MASPSGLLAVSLSGLALLASGAAHAAQPDPERAPKLDNPKIGFNGKAAITWGGDELLKATYAEGFDSSIDAGEGWFLSLGAEWDPIWFGDQLGLGIGLDGGLRHANLYVHSDGTASLERWALIPALRGLLHLGGSWYATAGVGLQFESAPRLKGEGLLEGLDVRFDPALGAMLEGGVRYLYFRHVGLDLTFRFTRLRYEAPGISVDANNLGLFLGVQYFL
jgi:hypothetical protein